MSHKRTFALLAVCTLLTGPGRVSAAAFEFITNGGFEQPSTSLAPDYYRYYGVGDTYTTGWTVNYDGSGEASYLVQRGGPYNANIIAGNQSIILKEGDLLFTSVSLVAGNSYTVNFSAQENSGDEDPNALKVSIDGGDHFFSPAVFPAVSGLNFGFTSSTTGSAILSFVVLSSQTYHSITLDNISMVPEPGAYAGILGVTALGFAARYRRRWES